MKTATKPISRIQAMENEVRSDKNDVDDAISYRAGLLSNAEALEVERSGNELIGSSLTRIADKFARKEGLNLDNDLQRAGYLLRSYGADMISNISRRTVTPGFQYSGEIWSKLAKQTSAQTFRPEDRILSASVGSLDKRGEDDTIKQGVLKTQTSSIEIKGYANILGLTRHAIVNDDISMLADAMQNTGRAATATIGDKFFSDLTANDNFSDGNALFSSEHSNVAAAGNAISEASIGEARLALRRAKIVSEDGEKSHVMNIPAKYILVPAALEAHARMEVAKQNQAAPEEERLIVLTDARLDDVSVTRWYVFADPKESPAYEVSGLGQRPAPAVTTRIDPNTDNLQIKVALDFDGAFVDYRSCYSNAGA